jgi:hypothetical protein
MSEFNTRTRSNKNMTEFKKKFKKTTTRKSDLIIQQFPETYISGMFCAHCIWLTNRFDLAKNVPHPILPPYYSTKSDLSQAGPGPGIVCFSSYGKFKYTWNCVYSIHSTTNILNLLIGVKQFLLYLSKEKGIHDTRLMLNSHFDMRKYGGKEHLHTLVTANSDESRAMYDRVVIGNDRTVYKTTELQNAPYPDDIQMFLTPEEAFGFFNESDTIGYLNRLIKEKYIPIDPLGADSSFYLFLSFNTNSDGIRILTCSVGFAL